jgi:hypothetical protein
MKGKMSLCKEQLTVILNGLQTSSVYKDPLKPFVDECPRAPRIWNTHFDIDHDLAAKEDESSHINLFGK